MHKEELLADPTDQFKQWYLDILSHPDIVEPTAMTLATVNQQGQPSARVVLLKHVDEQGFVFYTNYLSRKGQDIEQNSKVSLLFWWPPFARQVRIEGTIEKVDAQTSLDYFRTRARGSQLGAHASEQSKVIPSREHLEQQMQKLDEHYRDLDIPCPDHWGGYRVKPQVFEFWSGGDHRIHDRFRYQKHGDAWIIERLAP